MKHLKRHQPSAISRRIEQVLLEQAGKEAFWIEGQALSARKSTNKFWFIPVVDVGTKEADYNTYQLQLRISERVYNAGMESKKTLMKDSIVLAFGKVKMWGQKGQIRVDVDKFVVVRHGSPEAELGELRDVIRRDRLGAYKPPLPLFIKVAVLVSPQGTSEGDLAKDLPAVDTRHVPHVIHVPAPGDGPELADCLRRAAQRYPDADAFIFGRGGTIDMVSSWDREPVLRAVDEVQRGGTPVVVAVGHPEHQPLVYEVAATTFRSMAVAGTGLARHNRDNADRIRCLPEARANLQNEVQSLRVRVERARSATGDDLSNRTGVYRQRLSNVETQLSVELASALAGRRDELDKVATTGEDLLSRRLHELQDRTRTLTETLRGLRVGFALVETVDGRHLSEGIAVGEAIRFEQPDVQGTATVTTIKYLNRNQENAA